VPRKLTGPCSVKGCPGRATHAGRCISHRQSSTDRDYGSSHEAERRDWQRRMDRGETILCRRCGKPINPREPWDLGHPAPKHPEHRAHNRATMGRDRA
jgi:hypothetical protein